MRIDQSLAARDVTAVECDESVTRFDCHRAGSETKVCPDDSWSQDRRAFGAEQSPPWRSPVKITSAMKPVVERRQPPARERGQLPERPSFRIVWPDQAFSRAGDAPGGECFSAHERAEHLALDFAR